jgi:hypothetical protein
LAWSCSTTKYGVELIQYILILKWGITRVSLLVLHGSDTKETKYGIWLILYKLGRSWILICTWIKYYCTNKNNVLSISAFHRQAWKLFECQRWVNYYCLTNNNKWWFNPWIDLGQWRNKCGPYIYRSVRIVAGTDHHWNHLFFGYCPLFWDKDMWDKWFGENKKMRWWFFISPEYLTIAEDQHTNQLRWRTELTPIRWSLDRSWVHLAQLWRTKLSTWWSAESSWSTENISYVYCSFTQ